jgi:hypothetical protein
MALSMAARSTVAMGLNSDILRWLEIDILLLTELEEEVRLNAEEGEDDLGVDISELELL